MAQQIKIKIELENGKKIDHYATLKIWQYLFKHHEFKLVVPFEALEKDGVFFNNSHKDVIGKSITFSFDSDYEDNAESKFDFVFKGLITEISLKNEGGLTNSFVIRGYSTTIILEDATLKRTFVDLKVVDIFNKVLNEYPSNVLKKNNIQVRNSNEVKYTVQYNETNYEFLSRLAAEYGEWFYYNGEELQMSKNDGTGDVEFLINGSQSFDMSISLNPAKLKLTGYDYNNDQEFTVDTSGQNVDGLNQFGEFALNESEKLFALKSIQHAEKPVFDQSELDDFGKLKRSMTASDLVVFSGNGEVPNISVGTVINVKGSVPEKGGRSKMEDFGKYLITEITHTVDSTGNYSNSFDAVPDSVNFPPPNPRVEHPVGQTELARVVDNEDPEALGRVKVAFHWGSDSVESNWIRVGTFYSGNRSKGMFFIPEIGSQVVIGYELNHPEYPYVATSLYPNKSKLRAIADKNNEKYIYTQAGNQIVMYDESSKNKIEITNENKPDTKIVLEFESNGKVTIQTKGIVEIKADDSITIEAKEKLILKSKQIEMTAQNGLKMDGGTEAGLKGQQVKVEGTNTTVKGDSQAKIESAMTEVSASGIMTVKGSLVKIN